VEEFLRKERGSDNGCIREHRHSYEEREKQICKDEFREGQGWADG